MLRITPARIAFDEHGTPRSLDFDDVYHSLEGGAAQARHVFLAGNGLPKRWRGRDAFTIVETGFGLGINFLTTWQAWRADAERCARLHVVSIEAHPPTRDTLASALARLSPDAPLAEALLAQWPLLTPGTHRLVFDAGRLTLTLCFADALPAARDIVARADAFFLDGFAPAKNEAMWSVALMKALTRLAAPGATCATYTVARPVVDALVAAGFAVEKRAGFGRKRDMLCGRFAPRRSPRATQLVARGDERHAIVVGAGLAGAGVLHALTQRNWRITLVERHAQPAQEASGLHAGLFHPHVSRDDSVLSRLTRAGILAAMGAWRALDACGHGLAWSPCGVLQVARDDAEYARMLDTARLLAWPPEFVRALDTRESRECVGRATARGGWLFEQAGWLRASSFVRAVITAAGERVSLAFGRAAHGLSREDDLWCVRDASGTVIARAPVVILANAADAAALAGSALPQLRRVRGLVTYVPMSSDVPRVGVCGAAYAAPPIEGWMVAGATYESEAQHETASEESHASNLARLAQALPDIVGANALTQARGQSAERCVAADRLPLVGALPDVDWTAARRSRAYGARWIDLPRAAGLYVSLAFASRGLTWSVLAGELIAAQLEGEPWPIERSLAEAIDPARFAVRALRRGE